MASVVIENYERENAFGESEVRLLTTVAASMGVALENARLFDETQRLFKESEQRAAELAIINSVQQALAAELNMQGIYDAVGDKIREIFHQADVGIRVYDSRRISSTTRMRPRMESASRSRRDLSSDKGFAAHVLRTRETLLINEKMAEQVEAFGSNLLPGASKLEKSALFVPLIAGDQARGLISLIDLNHEHAYGDSDVRLLQTLASAMSVALENARLFDETQRATRETTALAEVGRDMSSTLDLAIVMDRIVHHARDLLNADNGAIFLPDAGGQTYRAIVAVGDIAEAIESTTIESGRGIIGSLVQSGRAEFVNDTGADDRAIQIAGTDRKEHERLMVAPLLAGEAVKGAMAVWRTGGKLFDDRELEFLVGLSRQATVALRNAQLFNETKEALEHQTATAEVLQVISESPTDVQPVFDIIAERAAKLTGAESGIVFRYDGEWIHVASSYGLDTGFMAELEKQFPQRSDARFISAEAIRSGAVVNVPDLQLRAQGGDDVPEAFRAAARQAGLRGGLCVPMFRDRQVVGAIAMYRGKTGKFADSEVELLRTFASQAVIAIENVRLFNETQEALARQTATSDVLQVISESPTDVQPVFDTIAERAAALTNSRYCLVTRLDGDLLQLVALHGSTKRVPL